jgi:large subunit ribosomal protein L35
MPKMKPHKGAKKRFRVTRNGKVVAASAFTGHMRASKSSRRKRRLRGVSAISKPDARRVKRLLGLM